MAVEEHQHQAEASIGTSDKKGKKKPAGREKKEPGRTAKKKVGATATTSVNEEQSTGHLDYPRVKVSEFDYCVENHFTAIDTIAELCGEAEDGDGGIDESDIQRFSSSTTFLRYVDMAACFPVDSTYKWFYVA